MEIIRDVFVNNSNTLIQSKIYSSLFNKVSNQIWRETMYTINQSYIIINKLDLEDD